MLELMDSQDQQVLSQTKLSKRKTKRLLLAAIVILLVVSGMVGYVIGKRVEVNLASQQQQAQLTAIVRSPSSTTSLLLQCHLARSNRRKIASLAQSPTKA